MATGHACSVLRGNLLSARVSLKKLSSQNALVFQPVASGLEASREQLGFMKSSVLGLIETRQQADGILQKLQNEGFKNEDISVLFPDKESSRDFAQKKETKLPEGATVGAGTGGVIGGVVGLLAGIGSLAIPGLGPFIAAGPIMAALSGGAIGAGFGGIAGALVGLGIPEYEAKRYEGKVKEGDILISVHTDNPEEIRRAKRIFEESHARDISTTGETHTQENTLDTGVTNSGTAAALGSQGDAGSFGSVPTSTRASVTEPIAERPQEAIAQPASDRLTEPVTGPSTAPHGQTEPLSDRIHESVVGGADQNPATESVAERDLTGTAQGGYAASPVGAVTPAAASAIGAVAPAASGVVTSTGTGASTSTGTSEFGNTKTVTKGIEIAAPIRVVYNQWTQFEDFPRFMEGVEEVHQIDDKNLHWRAKIGGKSKEWDARITQQIPDQKIAWESVSGAPNGGSVNFVPVNDERTQVTLTLVYEPEGMMEKTGDALGLLESRIDGDLKRFRDFLESRGRETGGWRGRVDS